MRASISGAQQAQQRGTHCRGTRTRMHAHVLKSMRCTWFSRVNANTHYGAQNPRSATRSCPRRFVFNLAGRGVVFQDIGNVTRGPIATFNSCIALASSSVTDVKVWPSVEVPVAVVIEAGRDSCRFGSAYGC